MDNKHVSEMIVAEAKKLGYDGLIVKYWGQDPDDEFEDGLTGAYDVFMIPDSKYHQFFMEDSHKISDGLISQTLFPLCLVTHNVSETKQYYPEICKEK